MLVSAAATLPVTGCATKLPTYERMGDEESLRTIARRQASVASISAAADISLTNEAGETVSLDGAFAAEPPSRARLRAWKFGTPVLDLTVTPEGVWAFAAEREGGSGKSAADLTRLPAAGISQAIELLSGAYFERARVVGDGGETFVVTGPAFGREDVRCEVDRSTLTPRRFWVEGAELSRGGDEAAGSPRFELALDRYALVGDIVWARQLRFTSPDGEIVLRLNDVELNQGVAEGAFTPPARATKLP